MRNSKLGNILFTNELAKRLEKRGSDGVYANSFFPGKYVAPKTFDQGAVEIPTDIS